eukprot:159225-Pyramimonas_sp.AAC.1
MPGLSHSRPELRKIPPRSQPLVDASRGHLGGRASAPRSEGEQASDTAPSWELPARSRGASECPSSCCRTP